MAHKVGGVGGAKAPTEEVHKIVADMHDAVKGKVGELKDAKAGEAVSFATQVVAGTNFFIKAKYTVGNDTKYAHLRVFRALGANGGYSLHSVQYPKGADDELSHF